LRETIEDAVQKLDPQGRNPALRRMILIGHSQGGLLAKWLVIDSGAHLWGALSEKPPEELRLSSETKVLLRRVYFVTPVPEVRRVIFIATPHHGSFVAENRIGQLLERLVTPGARILAALRDLMDDNLKDLKVGASSVPLGSVTSMSPNNPLQKAFAAIPVSSNVAAHSIIAVQGEGPIETGDDGVVSYQSAHIPEAVSELVIRSGHSVQSDPRTVNEVRRILLLHLNEICIHGCGPDITTVHQPFTAVGNVSHAAVHAGTTSGAFSRSALLADTRSELGQERGASHSGRVLDMGRFWVNRDQNPKREAAGNRQSGLPAAQITGEATAP
jgi:hypothetical protein